MDTLTEQQVKQYNKEGYVAPIDALTKEQALSARKEIEIIEKKISRCPSCIIRKHLSRRES